MFANDNGKGRLRTSFFCAALVTKPHKKSSRSFSCSFVECPAKLSNFFEDFNKIVDFIEKHCVLNKGYNINSL